MRRGAIEHRFVISLALSAVVGVAGLHAWPFPSGHALLGLIEANRPMLYAGFAYTYATVWFSTPFVLLNVVGSFMYVFVIRTTRRVQSAPLPPYPPVATRDDLFLVLGEQHRR